MNIPRVMIAAPRSGSGKTTITCAFIRTLKDNDISVRAFKCGPDYIDPMFHRNVLGVPSDNLDLFFTDEDTTVEVFKKDNESDISVIEGVMGLYDGLGGINIEASSYHLARVLKVPIILVIDTHGMGRSIVAEIAGFLKLDAEHLIKGVILNRIAPGIFESIKPIIEKELHIAVIGYYPVTKDISIESRYLGLKMPSEIDDIKGMIEKASEIFKQTVNLRALLRIAQDSVTENEEDFRIENSHGANDESSEEVVKIAVAMDEAFCFYYRDNLKMLRDNGAKIVTFSPIYDEKLPEGVSGVILGGGYPELFAKQLSENKKMRKSIKKAMESGMPSLAECGGFMYLHDEIEAEDGISYKMAGVVDGKCVKTDKLVRFGYVRIEDRDGRFLKDEVHNMIRGHEFHYYDSSNNGSCCIARKPVGGREWECAHVLDNHWWGFAHLYYRSNPDFAKQFMNKCIEYSKGLID